VYTEIIVLTENMRISFREAVSSGIDNDYPRFIDKFELKLKLGELVFYSEGSDREEMYMQFGGAIGRISRVAGTSSDVGHSPYLFDSNLGCAGGWIFNRMQPQENHRVYYEYKVADGDRAEGYNIPFFSGKMTLYKNTGEVNLDFSFNSMRFARYNRNIARVASRDSGGEVVSGVPRLGATREHMEQIEESFYDEAQEFSFDGGDNWLRTSTMSGAQWKFYDRNIKHYIDGVEAAVSQELERASGSVIEAAPLPEFRRYPVADSKYTLDYCEVAFEFSCNCPRQTLEELESLLEGYSRRGLVQREYDCCYERHTDASGWIKSYVIRLEAKNSIAVYAKTNKRIRIEVRYNNKEHNAPLRSKVTTSLDELIGKMSYLLSDAQRKVNHLLLYLREQQVTVTDTSKPIAELIMDIDEHCQRAGGGNREVTLAILEQLASTGGVRSIRGGNRQVNETIQSMKNRVPKIIQTSSTIGRYIATDDYQWAVSRLGEEGLWQRCVEPPEVNPE
jgi:hypothetical protein